MSRLARFLFDWSGWKIVGDPVPVAKCVIVVAFHTSNWDAWPCLVSNLALKKNVSWIGKHSLFWWPLGPFLRFLGGVPVVRGSKTDMVGQMVEQFAKRDHFALAIAPEGTRKLVHTWKTGFYYIALKAGVPLQCAALDYEHLDFVFDQPFMPSGDITADVSKMREFFTRYRPRYPERADLNFEIA